MHAGVLGEGACDSPPWDLELLPRSLIGSSRRGRTPQRRNLRRATDWTRATLMRHGIQGAEDTSRLTEDWLTHNVSRQASGKSQCNTCTLADRPRAWTLSLNRTKEIVVMTHVALKCLGVRLVLLISDRKDLDS